MATPKTKNLFTIFVDALGWPLLGGGIACIAFYLTIHMGFIRSPFVVRYFAGHAVEYVETLMFFVGIVAIAMTALNVVWQFGSLSRVTLTRPEGRAQTVEEVPTLLESLSELPEHLRDSLIYTRIQDALQHVQRKGTASQLDHELKHLSELASLRQYERSALVRIIIWATPMLGFLGTVIGITLALGNLSPQALVETPESAMESLLAGLSVAFDTTALALSLSIILMFCRFLTGQLESELLEAVDTRVTAELVGRFEDLGTTSDPHVASIRRMSDTVVHSVEGMVAKQTELWESAIATTLESWNGLSDTAADQLRQGLSKALRDSVLDHAAVLARSDEDAREQTAAHWQKLQDGLTKNMTIMQQQQTELARQGDIMLKVVNATGSVTGLQDTLNQNLQSLRQSQVLATSFVELSRSLERLNQRLSRPRDVKKKSAATAPAPLPTSSSAAPRAATVAAAGKPAASHERAPHRPASAGKKPRDQQGRAA